MKKILAILISISLMISILGMPELFAQTMNTGADAQSMQRLMDLGIFSKTAPDQMNLERQLTREELASVLVQVNGQQDKLSLYKNSSLYSDVPVSSWSNAAIQVAVKLGFMTSMPDGKFHPKDKISFGLVATVFGKMLNYDDANLPGSYPENYLTQLSNLDILDGIDYTANAFVTRGQLAVMLDRLYLTRVFGSDKLFVETLTNYQSAIVLENSITNPEDDLRRVLTHKGTFYLKEGALVPDAGKQYLFRLNDKEIQFAAPVGYAFTEVSVKSFSSGRVTTNSGERVTVPAGISYYYQGRETDYGTISASIQANSSVVICYNGSQAVYGALFDPLYSSPEVVTARTAGTALEIQLRGMVIEKGGKYITAKEIEVNDVFYKVTDLWNKYGYVLVYSNTVSGKITAILPNKVSPLSIEIDGKSYTLDETFPKEKLNASEISQVGETCKLIIGSTGKAVDLIADSIYGTNSYALVLNAYTENSIKTADFGTPYYYVTLLHSDGGKDTYLVSDSKASMRGKLVTYEVTAKGKDYDTVSLHEIETNLSGSYSVDKENRMLGDSYVANGAVLFNIVSTATPEINASVISFSDLPSGYLYNNKVKYIHKSGDFNDIDIMVLDNALDVNIAYALVTGKKTSVTMYGMNPIVTETVTLLVNGQTMTYTGGETGVFTNSPVKIKLNGNTVSSIEYPITGEANDNEIEAIDSSRIKVNGKVYSFHKNLVIYEQTGSSTWKKLNTSDLTKGDKYGAVSIYLDKPLSFGGKVVMVILR